MTKKSSSPVIVAVGPGPTDAAIAFGIEEAAATGSPLRLVHVVHLPPRGPEAAVLADRERQRAGRQALDAAIARAHELGPAGDSVDAELRLGPVVPTLAELASDARMIVLQRRDLSSVRRVVTRSVSSGVAARARVPVVSVPEQWSPARPHERVPTVTVGVDVPERSLETLRAAAAASRRREAVLHLVHVWDFHEAYYDLTLSDSVVETWNERAAAELQATVDGLGSDMQGVTCRIDVRRGPVADALLDAGRTSDLLVIGRHDHRVPLGSHLGPVARAILREAACPVLLVDPRPVPPAERGADARREAADQPV